ncbi:MAG TPA: hypothetical protein PLF96_12885, partial [Thermotogota bacterium]|nr:hypothetical protein [Thermotogota bacterium]
QSTGNKVPHSINPQSNFPKAIRGKTHPSGKGMFFGYAAPQCGPFFGTLGNRFPKFLDSQNMASFPMEKKGICIDKTTSHTLLEILSPPYL